MTQSNLIFTENHEIPEGYKKTELGIIPNDWQLECIGNIVNITTGNKNTQDRIPEGKYPFFVRSQKIERINSFSFDGEGVLTAGDGVGTGKVYHYINGKFDFHQRVYLMHSFNQKVHGYYFYIYFSNNFYDRIMSMTAKSSVDSVRRDMISNMKIVLPPLREQKKIATALFDTDVLISELEKLIEKKQAIKTATMQQLLTGKTRLPEFALREDGTPKTYKESELGQIPEDWGIFEINEVVENIIDYRGRTPRKLGMDWGGGNIVALSAGNVKKGYIDFDAECYLGSELLYKKWMRNGEAQKDDIAFTMEAPLGNVALIPDYSKYILSQRTILLQINRQEFDPHFVFHVLMSNEFEKYISDQATGSTAQGIKRSLFEKLKLVLPIKLAEQKSISQILDDFDFEIEKLNQKLNKLQLIKQGMMQELLTGKTRLV